MSGTFSSFNTALTGLRYQQVQLDIASTNVTNATTDGYVRRRVVGETAGAAGVPALWSRSDQVGSGVKVTGVDRMVDPLLDIRARTEHGKQAWLDQQSAVLARVETGIAEPGDSGVSAAIAGFKSSLHDLANAPDSDPARGQVLATAQTLANAFQLQARQLDTEAGDQRQTLQANVAEVNQVASDLASTNNSILSARLGGNDDPNLLDTRDKLALRLAELTGATGTVEPDGTMTVTVGSGSPKAELVSGKTAGELQIATGVTATGGSDKKSITFSIVTNGSAADPGSLGGQAGSVADLVDNVLPTYAGKLGAIAKQFADQLNLQQQAGYDANGNTGAAAKPLFSYDAADPAGSITVAITDPADLAASAKSGTVDGDNALAMADAVDGPSPRINTEGAYQQLVSGFGTQVASTQRLATNQQALTTQVDNSREQLAGVSLDEETVSMVQAQRAYEAAARVMTTVDSVLDTLINRTGLTH